MKVSKNSYFSKVCSTFVGLTIAFILSFICWMIYGGGNNSDSEFAIPPPSTLGTKDNNSCPVWSLVGDGYCDDEANIGECAHDLDDCCLYENDRSLCQNCSCILSNTEKQVIKEDFCNLMMLPDLGNGLCDLKFNNKEFFFDIGDCCFEWTSKHFNGDTLKYEYTYPHCIKSNNFCVPEELGDGICQDHNSGPYCDNDLGDCCLVQQNAYEECCNCGCVLTEPFNLDKWGK